LKGLPAYLLGIVQVLLPWASIPEVAKIFLEPDLEVECLHLVPSSMQELQSQAGVHTPAEEHRHPKLLPSFTAVSQAFIVLEPI